MATSGPGAIHLLNGLYDAKLDHQSVLAIVGRHDRDARRLAGQTWHFAEFVNRNADRFEFPKLHRHALVHGYCHQEAIMKMTDEHEVLRKLGVEFEAPDTGCCGMAGAFGFERGNYDVSVKYGERVLLPAVRDAVMDTLIIADVFSCREQIWRQIPLPNRPLISRRGP